MKDLRYILIDYGRFKDLETILKLKKIWKDSSQARHYTYFFVVIFILLVVATHFKNMLLIIALLILSFLSLLPLLIQQDNKFSMFGAFPRWNALWAKCSKSQSEVQVYDFTKKMKIQQKVTIRGMVFQNGLINFWMKRVSIQIILIF